MKYILDDIFASDIYKGLKEENFAKNLADMEQMLQDVMHSIEEMCFPKWNKPDLLPKMSLSAYALIHERLDYQ